MNYKIIALDLDDTLLREDFTISGRTKDALLRAQEKGVTVVLASGRPTRSMRRYERELELPRFGGYLISFNGAVITDCRSGEILFEQTLSKAQIHELHDISVSHDLFIQSYAGDRIITAKSNEYTDIEGQITGMEIQEVADFKAAMDRDGIKVIMLQEPALLKRTAEKIRPLIETRMNMCISKPFFLEFMDKGIDKKHSLEFLASRLGCTADEVIAVGDSYNDAGMIAYAGLGICMQNGPEDVRSLADHVTAGHMEDGVALAVERFIL
jgi:Cof subfamily protein (haloacid dehalogenase superfamily)